MNKDELKEILNMVADGELTADDALLKIKTKPYEDLGFARVDTHRGIRQGAGEVIYGAGKTKEQILSIAKSLINNGSSSVLVTRMSPDAAEYISEHISLKYDEVSKIGVIGSPATQNKIGKIVVATGGTSDIPVAEEAALTAEFYGNNIVRMYDVGVSGIHRIMNNLDDLASARAIIAVAGMEGALPSVIGGIADCPVIAVPTSVGYGASFGGLSALLSMLNSCASAVSVVNIDNGFGAGYIANMINKM
ncbi:MAG: nickel pincer cofactor biosynthesis protein LarB [Eubacterium sp.]